ncbi:MAG: HlyC/CorC family transporter, partial [Treponema sp.]|nr:HlyC/CorC family transporter [Treponema sp.]
VMVPRIDVDFIALGTPQDELLQKVTESGHSRFPVYSTSIDNVVGVLYVKDMIAVLARHEEINLEKIIRKPYFVPESKRIDSLLREFKRRHIHIALAIDEYGGISGIVCMEDIIEEIVGDIQDEFDNEMADILPLNENVWLCDARVSLDDLNETINSTFPTENFDTLGGFVFDLFGKIPVKFEKVSWHDWDFIVQEMEGHKVNVIKVILRKSKEKDNS